MAKELLGMTKKPMDMDEEDWKEMDARALSVIHLCFADDVMFNIVGEKTTTCLLTKLEILYMTKCLKNRS